MTTSPFLEGVRVIDFCWVGAGAFVTKMLADLGADVIKIESRARPDNLRVSPPRRPGAGGLESSGYFASRNSNKRSFALDMRKPEARDVALRLAASCSVVTSNFRPGVLERWGLAYDDVRMVNPEIIFLTMPMQGAGGPHSSFIGFGSTISSLSGLMYLSGDPERAPVGTGTHYPDHVPNPGHALVGLLSALHHRERTGRGQAVEVSQFESTVNVVGPAILAQSMGDVPSRTGNRIPGTDLSGVYACSGGEWIAIVARTEDDWEAVSDILGHPEWRNDPRFRTHVERTEHQSAVDDVVGSATAGFDRAQLVGALCSRGVAAAPVNSSREVLEDPDLEARGYWQQVEHPVIGSMAIARPPFRLDGGRPSLRPAPLLGEHTREVARELLGMNEAEIDRLVGDGVLE